MGRSGGGGDGGRQVGGKREEAGGREMGRGRPGRGVCHSPLPPQVRRSGIVPHPSGKASGDSGGSCGPQPQRPARGPRRSQVSLLECPPDPGIQQLVWHGHLGIPIWKFL